MTEGELIRTLRGYAGLTLVELGKSKEVGLSITALSKLENGARGVIGKESRDRLLAFLQKAIGRKRQREIEQAIRTRRVVARDYQFDTTMTACCAIYTNAVLGEKK